MFVRALIEQDEDQRCALLGAVVELHLELAYSQALRYRSRGVPLEDLRQVAALALVKASKRYDVTTGHDFLSYAIPTIRGELRKHFRDRGWMVRPPRRIQELQSRINAARGELTHSLGRSPTPEEIAHELDVKIDSVIEALACDGCFAPTSLDQPAGGEGTSPLGDLIRGDDTDHLTSEARIVLRPVIEQLTERDRLILRLRFIDGLTQREIGEQLGVGQMQVSRLLARIMGQLRSRIGELSSAS